MAPDADHLHALLAQRLVQRFGRMGRNMASALIVAVSAATAVLAVTLYRDTAAMMVLCGLLAVAFAVAYMAIRPRVVAVEAGADIHTERAKTK